MNNNLFGEKDYLMQALPGKAYFLFLLSRYNNYILSEINNAEPLFSVQKPDIWHILS
jgi:hypothetical protein